LHILLKIGRCWGYKMDMNSLLTLSASLVSTTSNGTIQTHVQDGRVCG